MSKIYLFDVDGTLTPPRMPMDESFSEFFDEFTANNPVYLISGSDYKKICEQVPRKILLQCKGVYGCSGAEYYEQDEMQYTREHEFPEQLIYLCKHFIQGSSFHIRTGNHIEERPGMLNISSVGRNASEHERQSYYAWDQITQERVEFVKRINSKNLGYEASAGGEISIDIVPEGWNKSVVKNEVLKKYPDAELVFFGDRIVENGNDLPLAKALETPKGRHASYRVYSFHDTRKLLEGSKPVFDKEVA
jgi:phosphomannomutase